MQRRITSQDITWFVDLNGLGRLDLEPAYQRRSVWTRRDRQYFLDTIFNNYPSPAIFLHKDLDENGRATYHVVDGKQRLETILLFLANKLPIRDDFGDARLNNKKWRDLQDEHDLKKTFLDYQITVEQLDSIETTVVNDIFGRLNRNSRKLERQEIRHARFDGWFVNRAEQETEEPFWKTVKISTAGRHKRMLDTQYISELMAATIERRVIGFDQDLLDEIYAAYEFPQDLESPLSTEDFNAHFGSVRAYVQDLESHGAVVTRYATNLAHFYTLWVWLASRDELPSVSEFASRYAEFMDAVAELAATAVEDTHSVETTEPDEVVEVVEVADAAVSPADRDEPQRLSPALRYLNNARGATTDGAQRQARHDALDAALGFQ